jgi:ABC-2 type transport system permease protein
MLKFGAITCVVMLILGILAAGSEFRHLPPGAGRLYAGTVISSVCFWMIGVALGALIRNTIGAVVAAIAWTLFVEQVILAAIVPGIEKWLPTAAIGLTNAPGPGPRPR